MNPQQNTWLSFYFLVTLKTKNFLPFLLVVLGFVSCLSSHYFPSQFCSSLEAVVQSASESVTRSTQRSRYSNVCCMGQKPREIWGLMLHLSSSPSSLSFFFFFLFLFSPYYFPITELPHPSCYFQVMELLTW